MLVLPRIHQQHTVAHLGEEDTGIGGHITEAVQRGIVDVGLVPDTVLEDLEERSGRQLGLLSCGGGGNLEEEEKEEGSGAHDCREGRGEGARHCQGEGGEEGVRRGGGGRVEQGKFLIQIQIKTKINAALTFLFLASPTLAARSCVCVLTSSSLYSSISMMGEDGGKEARVEQASAEGRSEV